MTNINSAISWTDGTLNLTVGCTKVSAACDHCYAEAFVQRGILPGGRDFSTLQFYPHRLKDLGRFKPRKTASGEREPRMVFVNSLSDFWHEDIPDQFIHDALDAFERHPWTIMQVLTKRPVRMRKMITDRYGNRGVPGNLWLGVSAEDNRVKGRLNVMRRLKDRVGDFTAFVSVEPIVAPTDKLDYSGIDWVLTGGESGPRARPMRFEWLSQANEQALSAGIALHFKQYGTAFNNPYVRDIMRDENVSISRAFGRAVARGLELAPHEKGGATYRDKLYHERPPHWHKLKVEMNGGEPPARRERILQMED